MQTEHYPHKIAAIYQDAVAAETALRSIRSAGLKDAEVMHLYPGRADFEQAVEPEQAATRNHFVRDILLGGGIGTAVGAVGAGAIALALPSLFVAVPVVGPLMVAGYGTTLGVTAGAVKGLKVKESLLAGMVGDALDAGYHVLVIHSASDATHAQAEQLIESTLAEETASV